MKGFKTLHKTAQIAKQVANVQKSIKNCPYCTTRQNEIKEHVMRGHPHEPV